MLRCAEKIQLRKCFSYVPTLATDSNLGRDGQLNYSWKPRDLERSKCDFLLGLIHTDRHSRSRSRAKDYFKDKMYLAKIKAFASVNWACGGIISSPQTPVPPDLIFLANLSVAVASFAYFSATSLSFGPFKFLSMLWHARQLLLTSKS